MRGKLNDAVTPAGWTLVEPTLCILGTSPASPSSLSEIRWSHSFLQILEYEIFLVVPFLDFFTPARPPSPTFDINLKTVLEVIVAGMEAFAERTEEFEFTLLIKAIVRPVFLCAKAWREEIWRIVPDIVPLSVQAWVSLSSQGQSEDGNCLLLFVLGTGAIEQSSVMTGVDLITQAGLQELHRDRGQMANSVKTWLAKALLAAEPPSLSEISTHTTFVWHSAYDCAIARELVAWDVVALLCEGVYLVIRKRKRWPEQADQLLRMCAYALPPLLNSPDTVKTALRRRLLPSLLHLAASEVDDHILQVYHGMAVGQLGMLQSYVAALPQMRAPVLQSVRCIDRLVARGSLTLSPECQEAYDILKEQARLAVRAKAPKVMMQCSHSGVCMAIDAVGLLF